MNNSSTVNHGLISPTTIDLHRSWSWDVLALMLGVAAFLILTVSGLQWGVPSSIRNALEPPPEAASEVPSEMVEHSWDYWRTRDREPEKHVGYTRDLFNSIRSYHPDEYMTLKSLSNMRPSQLNFDPHLYTYPVLHTYCVGAGLKLAGMVGYVSLVKDMSYYFEHPGQMARMYVVGRLLSILFGVGAMITVFFAARSLFGTAALAVLFLALSPIFTIHSHYMTRYVLSALLASLLFLSCIRLANTGLRRWYIFAAVFAGLCAGTNYMWLIFWLMIPIAHALAVRNDLRRWLDMWLFLTIPILFSAFLIGAGYALSKPVTMLNDFRSEIVHWTISSVGSRFITFSWVLHLVRMLPAMFGYPATGLIVGGIIATLYEAFTRRNHLDVLLLAWLVPVWLVVGIDSRDYSRYYVIIAPAIAMIAAQAPIFIWRHTTTSRLLQLWGRRTTIALVTIALVSAFATSLVWSNLFATGNIRTTSGLSIMQSINQHSTIGMTKPAWQYEMPPIDPQKYDIVVTGEDLKRLALECPDYFVASSAQYGPVLRDQNSPAVCFWSALLNGHTRYMVERRFERAPRLGGIEKLIGWVPDGMIPEDMTYVNPTILLFRRLRECHD